MCFFTYHSTDYPPLRKHSGSEVSSAGDCLGLWVLPKWAGRLSITDCQVGGGLIRWEYKEKEDVMKYRMIWRSSQKIRIYYKMILFRPALHTSSSPRITRLEMMIKSLKRILMLKWAGLETPCLSITDCKVGGEGGVMTDVDKDEVVRPLHGAGGGGGLGMRQPQHYLV